MYAVYVVRVFIVLLQEERYCLLLLSSWLFAGRMLTVAVGCAGGCGGDGGGVMFLFVVVVGLLVSLSSLRNRTTQRQAVSQTPRGIIISPN